MNLDNKKTFSPSSDFKDNYKILIGSVVPRPIAVVSTLNENGTNNLAPFSFFTVVSANPMVIAFCPFIRSSDGEEKDTAKNIKREKEFTLNFCTEQYAEKINLAATELPYGEDEFSFSGLTPLDSTLVKPKLLRESPINFECKLRDTLSYGESLGAGQIITGEVVKIHIADEIFKDGKIDTDLYNPIGRGAGNDWILTNSRMQLERKSKAQIQK
ncbi:MAG: flavin reductase family protein [Bacteriovoracaceae bacterium]